MANPHPKAGPGRSKGSKNKMTMEMDEFLAMADRLFPGEENHPLANQLLIAKSSQASIELKQKAWNDITGYLIGKKKAVEHSGEVQDSAIMTKVKKLSGEQFKALLDVELLDDEENDNDG